MTNDELIKLVKQQLGALHVGVLVSDTSGGFQASLRIELGKEPIVEWGSDTEPTFPIHIRLCDWKKQGTHIPPIEAAERKAA